MILVIHHRLTLVSKSILPSTNLVLAKTKPVLRHQTEFTGFSSSLVLFTQFHPTASAWSELIPTEPCPHEEPRCLGCGCMHLLKLPARQFTLVSLSFRLCRQWSLFLQAREDDSAQHNPNALCCNLTWPAGVRFVILWHIVTLDYYFDTQSVNRCQSIEIMKITIHFFSVKVLYFDISVPVIL